MLDFETLTKLETCLKNAGFNYDFSIDDNHFFDGTYGKYKSLTGWALRDSNPRPSACKADALNQLS